MLGAHRRPAAALQRQRMSVPAPASARRHTGCAAAARQVRPCSAARPLLSPPADPAACRRSYIWYPANRASPPPPLASPPPITQAQITTCERCTLPCLRPTRPLARAQDVKLATCRRAPVLPPPAWLLPGCQLAGLIACCNPAAALQARCPSTRPSSAATAPRTATCSGAS
jgi:hypothetical protein